MLKLCTLFDYSISIKVIIIWVSIIYWLQLSITKFMKQSRGLDYCFPLCLKFYQVTTYLASHISCTCIACTFKTQSMFINYMIFICKLTNQRISLLSVFPFKLVISLSIIVMMSTLPRTSQSKLSGRLGRFALG